MYHPSRCNVLTVTMSLEHLMKLSISIVRASSSVVCFRVKFGAAFWVTALGLWSFGITVRKPKGDGVRSFQPYTASILPRSLLKILPPILSWFWWKTMRFVMNQSIRTPSLNNWTLPECFGQPILRTWTWLSTFGTTLRSVSGIVIPAPWRIYKRLSDWNGCKFPVMLGSIDSMVERIQAVITAEGGHTKY